MVSCKFRAFWWKNQSINWVLKLEFHSKFVVPIYQGGAIDGKRTRVSFASVVSCIFWIMVKKSALLGQIPCTHLSGGGIIGGKKNWYPKIPNILGKKLALFYIGGWRSVQIPWSPFTGGRDGKMNTYPIHLGGFMQISNILVKKSEHYLRLEGRLPCQFRSPHLSGGGIIDGKPNTYPIRLSDYV